MGPRSPPQTRPIDGSAGLKCYSPAQIQTAYGITPLLNKGINGKGETIAIHRHFSLNPYVAGDLAIQDSTFGLPTPVYNAITPKGVPRLRCHPTTTTAGWAEVRSRC